MVLCKCFVIFFRYIYNKFVKTRFRMSSVVYSLKNGINRTNNPSIGGVFAYGSYTSAGVFTLFTDYEYEDGTAFTGLPFDASKPLVWKGATQYPHIGFENLTPNLAITPQPFPSFGIYLHPFIVDGVRQDVGIRVTIPFTGSVAISSVIQRADLNCGDDIGYRIMRNGVAIQARQFIQPSSVSTTINTPSNTFVAGDIIDFIVDIGSQSNSFCDDTALEVTLNYQYTQIPKPVLQNTIIFCSTTEINGTTAYVSEGTFASIYDGTSKLYSTAVVLNQSTLSGTFSFDNLDFITLSGKRLHIILENSGDTPSDKVEFVIQEGGCLDTEPNIPIITGIDFCRKKCYNERLMMGNNAANRDVVVFEYPYKYGNPIIAAGFSYDGGWEIESENFLEGKRYVAFLLNYEGELDTEFDILSISCERQCSYKSSLKGSVAGITNGILKVFESPYTYLSQPIEAGIVRNGLFNIKTNSITPNIEYVFIAVKID